MTIRRPRRERLAALAGFAERLEPGALLGEACGSGRHFRALQSLAARAGQELGRRRLSGTEGAAQGPVAAAIFAGSDAAGKTNVAAAMGRELGLEVYRIDLTKVVSKYIGETEKNLGEIFAAAEDRRALLYFDEADGLFGQRSDVRDSHDRHAEAASCLFERASAFGGMVILSVASAEAIDERFRRQVGTVVEFPD
jgi:SpoVK/Ycf46/Vps4 family AAA+-type ATPase